MTIRALLLWTAAIAIMLTTILRSGAFERLYLLSKPFEAWCFSTFGVGRGITIYLVSSWLSVAGACVGVGAVLLLAYDACASDDQ